MNHKKIIGSLLLYRFIPIIYKLTQIYPCVFRARIIWHFSGWIEENDVWIVAIKGVNLSLYTDNQ